MPGKSKPKVGRPSLGKDARSVVLQSRVQESEKPPTKKQRRLKAKTCQIGYATHLTPPRMYDSLPLGSEDVGVEPNAGISSVRYQGVKALRGTDHGDTFRTLTI
jgi:hypothetical protein